ncbi:xanthine dehydrogenase family protein molybdopterin-binding subunit [Streptosporangium lutulentum]
MGAFRPDLYPLAVGRVRYVGDEVAAVAAADAETARRAAELVSVEYEVLPAVLGLDEALAEGAPLVHDDAPGNVAHEFSFDRGGADEWFARSDVIVEGVWQSARQWHGSIETIGCTAEWSQDRVTLWVNTQTPFLARQRYATALGLPLRSVRVVQTEVGGGFGGKSGDDNTSVICAILARRTGRPVQLLNTREEEFLAGRPRTPMRCRVRLGFTSDGLVTAKDLDLIADNGAYTGKSLAVLGAATVRHDALFAYRAVRARSRLVYTNLVPTGAFRGFGNPSADWAVGQAWDLAAARLGIEMPDLLLLNAVEEGDVSLHNHRIGSCELKQCIRKAADAIGWYEKRAAPTPHHGLAMGVSVHVSGQRSFGDYDGSSAIVRLTEDGRAVVITGEGEIGTGARTTLAQIAAAELGLAVTDVTVSRPDTDLTTHALGALASRVTYVAGNAVKRAAEQACERLLAAAARQLGRSKPELWVENGLVCAPTAPGGDEPVRLPVGVVVRAELYRPGGEPIVGLGSFDNPSEFPDEVRYGNESGAYTFAAEAAEVEVDPATGAVTVLELAAVVDCGTVLNPPLAEGQVEGAIAQGLGMAVTERLDWADGAPARPNFADYKLPTSQIMPRLHVEFAAPTSRRDRSARRASARSPWTRSRRSWRAPWPTPWACASTNCRSRPRRSSGASGPIPAEKLFRGVRPAPTGGRVIGDDGPRPRPPFPGTSRDPTVLLTPRSLDEALRLLAAEGAAVLGGGVGHTLRRHDRRRPGPAALVSVGSFPSSARSRGPASTSRSAPASGSARSRPTSGSPGCGRS